MTPNNPHTHPPQYPPPSHHQFAEVEISLFDLWNVLVRRWQLIVATTLLATLLATVFALTTSPLYRATVYILPPEETEIEQFNTFKKGLQSVQGLEGMQNIDNSVLNALGDVTVENVYSLYKQTLNSERLNSRYFSENHLKRSFVDGTPTTEINPIDKKLITFSVEWHDPDEAADWANGLSQMANILVNEQIFSNINSKVQQQIQYIEIIIITKRKLAKKTREDRIVQLKEALQTSINIGLMEKTELYVGKDPPVLTYRLTSEEQAKALKAKIHILQSRVNDDPFIPGMRKLQELLFQLRMINFNNTSLNTYTLEQPALPPQQRGNKPSRQVIITTSGIIGLMGSACLAFLINFIQNQKNRSEED